MLNEYREKLIMTCVPEMDRLLIGFDMVAHALETMTPDEVVSYFEVALYENTFPLDFSTELGMKYALAKVKLLKTKRR